jgi:hypothetical protein
MNRFALIPARGACRLAAAGSGRQLVAHQLAAAADENRRPSDQTRLLLLVAAGGEPPDAAAVWRHAVQDLDGGVASGIRPPLLAWVSCRFFDGFPDKETTQKDYDNLDFQRGVEVFLNTCPVWHGGFPLSTTKE